MGKIGTKLLNALPTLIVACVLAGILGWVSYSFQPSWDFHFAITWFLLFCWIGLGAMSIVAFIVADGDYNDGEEKLATFGNGLLCLLVMVCVFGLLMGILGMCNGAWLNSEKFFNYVKPNVTVIESDAQLPDIIGENGDTSHIAIIEDNEAFKKANIAIAEAQLGNRNSVNTASLTSQEVNGKFIYVLTLKPNSWFKWDGTTKGYITIDRNGGETNIIADEFTYSIDAKFGSMLFHGNDNVKKLLIEKFGGNWVDIDIELDDEGKPHWVATKTTQSGVAGYTKVLMTAIVDPFTGDVETYDIGKEPEWVERVYPEETLIEYMDYYGKYIHGWVNSWKECKDVMITTAGYNVVYIDGVPHVWTGITTPNASNEASLGIAIGNLKTGKITIYKCGGVSETHAQNSAQGLVKDKGYTAGFPVILNVNGTTSYFMLLRDDNMNVQGYAFVSYKDYTKAAFATTVKEALTAYKAKLNTVNTMDDAENSEEVELTGVVTDIGQEVVDGRTTYYLKIEGSDKVFVLQSGLNVNVVFLNVGDVVTVKHYKNNANVVTLNAMSIN